MEWIKARDAQGNYFIPLKPCFIAYTVHDGSGLLSKFWDGRSPFFNTTMAKIHYYFPIELPPLPNNP